MEYPPVEPGLESNTHLYYKLSNLDMVRLLEVGQLSPRGRAFLQLIIYEPVLGKHTLMVSIVDHDLLLVKGKGIECMPENDEFVQEVYSCLFGSHWAYIALTMGCEGHDFAINKLNVVKMSF